MDEPAVVPVAERTSVGGCGEAGKPDGTLPDAVLVIDKVDGTSEAGIKVPAAIAPLGDLEPLMVDVAGEAEPVARLLDVPADKLVVVVEVVVVVVVVVVDAARSVEVLALAAVAEDSEAAGNGFEAALGIPST